MNFTFPINDVCLLTATQPDADLFFHNALFLYTANKSTISNLLCILLPYSNLPKVNLKNHCWASFKVMIITASTSLLKVLHWYSHNQKHRFNKHYVALAMPNNCLESLRHKITQKWQIKSDLIFMSCWPWAFPTLSHTKGCWQFPSSKSYWCWSHNNLNQ